MFTLSLASDGQLAHPRLHDRHALRVPQRVRPTARPGTPKSSSSSSSSSSWRGRSFLKLKNLFRNSWDREIGIFRPNLSITKSRPLNVKPLSSGYGRRLMFEMFERLWVQIPAPYTGWTFFYWFFCKNVCLKWTENKWKRGRGWRIAS